MVETRRRLFSMQRLALLAVLILGLAGTGRAAAQSYDAMGCDELWYARNAIYAANGYCFKTARARQVFGPGCVPPYGNLNANERGRVSTIQQWERSKGCQ